METQIKLRSRGGGYLFYLLHLKSCNLTVTATPRLHAARPQEFQSGGDGDSPHGFSSEQQGQSIVSIVFDAGLREYIFCGRSSL